MATYYVKLAADGGNDSFAGTSPSTAWATIGKALGATGISSGDTVYIAPGTYNESVTIGITNPTAETFIIGDPTASQFPGLAAGPVYHSAWNAAGTTQITSGVLITGTTKNYLHFQNIWWSSDAANMVVLNTSRYAKFTKCQFVTSISSFIAIRITSATSTPIDATITRCAFIGLATAISLTGTNTTDATLITDCLFLTCNSIIDCSNSNFSCFNCTFFRTTDGVIQRANTTGTASFVRNSLFLGYSNFSMQSTTGSGPLTATYNRFIGSGTSNIPTSTTNVTTGAQGVDYTYLLNQGMNYQQMWTSLQGGPNIAFGTATGAPAADLYGVTWTGASPDAGSGAYRVINSTPSQIAYNGGNERNASAITIAPASTSQSIELFLGATGLAFNTAGLAAYYVRNQAAPVAITLVTQTPTGAWTSGGFAEISSSLVPGVYRLDVPNAAFAAGASDVTIVVRGASGTNGAVLTVTLSSGGLTAAQTAAAVWDATVAGYNTATNFGGVMMETNNVVNGIESDVQDVPSNVWQELRTSHTTAGTFGQYVNAELVTPVTSAALVRMGPFEVRADGLGASDPLDIQKGAQHGIDIQCVDNNNAGIDITSATVTAKVYNSGATLVDTYACTATYAADGRATFTIDTTVTNVPGTYTATITRTTGASDTQIFGPLRIYVRDI
jgi:hypothetical protein